MSEQEKQESQKTVVAFAAGLLIGGLLVWIFGGAPQKDDAHDEMKKDDQKAEEIKIEQKTEGNTQTAEEKPEIKMEVGEGKVEVTSQTAGKVVKLDSATFPSDDGWVGIRDYADGKAGYILGVARFSKSQGLVPSEVSLIRPTVAGNEYAVVYFKEDGDRKFNASKDTQLEGTVATFKAQ